MRSLLRSVVLVVALLFGATPSSALDLPGWLPFSRAEQAGQDSDMPVRDPIAYSATLLLNGPSNDDLESGLIDVSELLDDTARPPSGSAGLVARALSDFERLVGKLYAEGYYAGTVDIRVAGLPLRRAAEVADLPGPRPVPVLITVTPGARFVFGDVRISGEATPVAGDSYGLVPGEVARSGRILAAEERILADIRSRGYPFARIATREVIADHDTKRLDVRLVVSTGAAARFGVVDVQGAEVTDRDFIVTQAALPVDAPYSPDEIARARQRLLDLGIFSSVRIVAAQATGPDGRLPMTIEVSERKRNIIGVGVNWSSSEGFGVESYWRRRNLFGRGELLSVEGSVGRLGDNDFDDLEYAARIAFEKPGAFGPQTRFVTSLGARQEIPDAYRSRHVTADAFVIYDHSDALSLKLGGEVQYASETDVFGSERYLLTGLIAEVLFDTRNDPLNPSSGVNARLFVEPAYDAKGNTGMLFASGSIASYRALDDSERVVLAGRLAAGSIVAPSVRAIPAARRYFSGGGGSIRGYAYRNVGPRLAGEVTGGRSFIEASAELRVKATETIGLVGFVDAGNSYDAVLPDFDNGVKVGVGAGVRYFTPVGPLRFDVAVPLDPEQDDPDFAVYIGLSQAF